MDSFLGLNKFIKNEIQLNNIDINTIARVITVHKDSYVVKNKEGIFRAEITGNMRYSAESSNDLPAVGDWVQIMKMDKSLGVIINILKRFSKLERQAIDKFGDTQIIATNIDYAFIITSANHDFNFKRLDRYVTICNKTDITPIIVLSKCDLINFEEQENLRNYLSQRFFNIKVLCLTKDDMKSFYLLSDILEPNKTYCFVGSSGVGKSTIINFLIGDNLLKTQEISTTNNKGKHTTTHKELIELSNGAIVIDTPGMREVGITEGIESINTTFTKISELSLNCKFRDCKHSNEQGCAVLEALKNGNLSTSEYNSYIKLNKEQEHFTQSIHQKRKKEKNFSKIVKNVKNLKNQMK